MWETLKLCVSYGFRGEYGVSYEMYNTIDERVVLDFIFYFVVSMLNINIFCTYEYNLFFFA